MKDPTLEVDFISVYNNYGNYKSQVTLRGNWDANSFVEVYKNPDKLEYLLAVYKFSDDTRARIAHALPEENLNSKKLISEPMNGAIVFNYVL